MISILMLFFGFLIYSLLFFLWPDEPKTSIQNQKNSPLNHSSCSEILNKFCLAWKSSFKRGWKRRSKLSRQIYLMFLIKIFFLTILYFAFFSHKIERKDRQNKFLQQILEKPPTK